MSKEVYIAYFDLLGFKEFIENNTEEYIDKRMESIFGIWNYHLPLKIKNIVLLLPIL